MVLLLHLLLGDMDKMAIFRYKTMQNGNYSYNYTCIRCSYPIYITSRTGRNEPFCDIYSINNNTNTYMKQATSTERATNTTIALSSFTNKTTGYLEGVFNNRVSIEGDLEIVYSNVDIYRDNEIIYQDYISPSLSNTQSQLENLSFNNFIINANSFTQDMIENPDEPLVMLFYNRSLSNNQNTDGLYPIKEKYFYKESIYYDSTNSTDTNYIFTYPIFRSGVFFNIGSTYEIKLAKRVYIEEYNTWGYDFFDNNYVFTVSSNVTQDYINQLNQQTATSTDEEQQNELQNSINQQTQSIDNINNSITDSNVDNSSIDLPTDNTQDPTLGGINNIFQTIYNGFTSGTPQNIVFPLPYSTNNITITPNYVSQMLNSSERGENCFHSYSSFLLVRDK